MTSEAVDSALLFFFVCLYAYTDIPVTDCERVGCVGVLSDSVKVKNPFWI